MPPNTKSTTGETSDPISKPSSNNKVLLLALSGPSSSGKTTLARLLHRSILPPGTSTLLHLDDFYHPEPLLPRTASGLLDWDSAESLDLDGPKGLVQTLEWMKGNGGRLPGDFVSLEEGNGVGAGNPDSRISDATVTELKAEVVKWWPECLYLVIVDGFLLLGESIPQIRNLFDIKILLRARFFEAKARREGRDGYATIEGWWEDPKGYVEDVVWPGFVKEHAFLYREGNVEGEIDEFVVDREGVRIAPWGELEDGLRWVVERIREDLEDKVRL